MIRPRNAAWIATIPILIFCANAVFGQFGDDAGAAGAAGIRDVGPEVLEQSPGQRLARNPLGPVPEDLLRPIGIAVNDQQIWDKLRSSRTMLNFVEAPLGDVITFVRNQTNLNIIVDRLALDEEGVSSDTPVTAAIRDTRLDLAIDRLLESLNLTLIVKDGAVVITSELQAGDELTIRVYPVADLVWATGRAGMDTIDAEPLITTIEETAFANTWDTVGGPGTASFFPANLSLAVLQTSEVHDQIAELLEHLRRARTAQPETALDTDVQPDVRTTLAPARHPPARTAVIGVSEAERTIRDKLRETPITLKFVETPLNDVVAFLRKFTGLDIDVDRVALGEDGLTDDTPLTFEIMNAPLGNTLNLMLGQLNLTWVIRRETLTITSQLAAGNETVVRSYPVADLVVVRDGEDRWTVGDDELIELIERVVQPSGWSSVGGPGTIRFFVQSQCLIVNQTQQVHELIADVLSMLREASSRLPEIGLSARLPLTERLRILRLKQVGERR